MMSSSVGICSIPANYWKKVFQSHVSGECKGWNIWWCPKHKG